MSTRALLRVIALLVAAFPTIGCSSPFDGASITLEAVTPGSDRAVVELWVTVTGPETPCPLSRYATMSINGDVSPAGSCTGEVTFSGNPSFNIRVTDGGDVAEMVVGGLEPGLDATLEAPADGQASPGADLSISIPPAEQIQTPVAAEFRYTDADDPSYAGDTTYPTGSDGQTVHVPAPQHAGHFTFAVLMNGDNPNDPFPSGNVVSCSGFAHCFAAADPQLGPLAIDVVP